MLFAGGYGGVGGARGLAWFYFAGGLLGAVYVTTALITVRLGAGAVTAATVTGQLVTSLTSTGSAPSGSPSGHSPGRGCWAWRCWRRGPSWSSEDAEALADGTGRNHDRRLP